MGELKTQPGRSLEQLWARWKFKAKSGLYPFEHAAYQDIEQAFEKLESYDRDTWAETFSAVAIKYQEQAHHAEAEGQLQQALRNYMLAYGHYRVARFPTSNSAGKWRAYDGSRQMFLAASRFFSHDFQRVKIPMVTDEGTSLIIPGYLCLADQSISSGLVIHWGGIDSFKEERYGHVNVPAFLDQGLSMLLIDMPGTGEAPVNGSGETHSMFTAVIDWASHDQRTHLLPVCLYGGSFGGYWSAMLAHIFVDRVACVVSHGGCVHHAFQKEWIDKAQEGEYPFEYSETHAHAFGLSTAADWEAHAPSLSLLDRGILEQPCAPLLLVDGIHDSVFPIEDTYLLLQHGDPKAVRLYLRGHMGMTVDTIPQIIRWIATTLSQ